MYVFQKLKMRNKNIRNENVTKWTKFRLNVLRADSLLEGPCCYLVEENCLLVVRNKTIVEKSEKRVSSFTPSLLLNDSLNNV